METESQAGSTPTGPYVSAAVFAEKILVERDGTKSLIRVIDRVTRATVGPQPPDTMEPFDWQATLFVSLKPGQARGGMSFRIIMEAPSGLTQEVGCGILQLCRRSKPRGRSNVSG